MAERRVPAGKLLERVTERKQDLGLTWTELATMCGVSRTTLTGSHPSFEARTARLLGTWLGDEIELEYPPAPALTVIACLELEYPAPGLHGSRVSEVLSDRTGRSRETWERRIQAWRRGQPLSDVEADELSTAAGRHPDELWASA